MQKILLILSFFSTSVCYGNRIDKLTNNIDVQNFLKKKVSRDFKYKTLFKSKSFTTDTTSFAYREFSKIDIDKNGLTDLIVHVSETFVVLDRGLDGYLLRYLDRGNSFFNKTSLIKIDTSFGLCKLLITQRIKKEKEVDTLIFRFKSFIEYNPKIEKDFKFESIKFKTERCLGTCPIFEIALDSEMVVNYEAIEFNEEKGKFKGLLNEVEFKEFIEILNYLNLDSLKNFYAVDWTDDQSVTLEIKYNGKTKTIKDYGEVGTFGLNSLYSKLFSWRKKIDWSE